MGFKDMCRPPRASDSGSRVWRLPLEFLYLEKSKGSHETQLPLNTHQNGVSLGLGLSLGLGGF